MRQFTTHPDQPVDKNAARKPFITTAEAGMSGHFAVLMWWNSDMGGFWEPWDTGIGRFPTKAQAINEAREWAEAEGLEYLERA